MKIVLSRPAYGSKSWIWIQKFCIRLNSNKNVCIRLNKTKQKLYSNEYEYPFEYSKTDARFFGNFYYCALSIPSLHSSAFSCLLDTNQLFEKVSTGWWRSWENHWFHGSLRQVLPFMDQGCEWLHIIRFLRFPFTFCPTFDTFRV